MLDEILVLQLSIRPIDSEASEKISTNLPASQFCLNSSSSLPSCIYTHEIVSLILAIAILIKAIRGASSR